MNAPSAQPDALITEKRSTDRRATTWSTLYGALFTSRRRRGRREGDRQNSYTDWYGISPLITTMSIILLCFADAFFTTVLLSRGAVEMNIFMDWLIRFDMQAFAVVKMSLTGIALLILVMHYNFRIYRVIEVRYVLVALLSVYCALLTHQLSMLAII